MAVSLGPPGEELIHLLRRCLLIWPNEIHYERRNSVYLHDAIPLALGIVPHLRKCGGEPSHRDIFHRGVIPLRAHSQTKRACTGGKGARIESHGEALRKLHLSEPVDDKEEVKPNTDATKPPESTKPSEPAKPADTAKPAESPESHPTAQTN